MHVVFYEDAMEHEIVKMTLLYSNVNDMSLVLQVKIRDQKRQLKAREE